MITRERILESFSFDEAEGRFYWVAPPDHHGYLKGKEAGSLKTERTGKQYWFLKIDNIGHKRSRLAFLMTHGKFPFPCVDHISGDSLDDRPCNLREATEVQNAQNRKIHKKTNDLPRGVKQVKNRFVALIRHNKKQIHLGTFDTIGDALAIYTAKRKEFFGEYSGY